MNTKYIHHIHPKRRSLMLTHEHEEEKGIFEILGSQN
jgi:hypothetical protein